MPECAKISRAISKYLDEESPLDFAFNLEVSSPGLGKPILVPRQYIRHLGKKLRVKFSTGDKAEGFLQGFDEQGIKLKTLPVKKEKKQVTEEEIFIPFTDIKEAIVLVSFN